MRSCEAGRTRRSLKKSRWLSWRDGQLDYDKLRDTINEAVSGYPHLYAYGIAKTRFLTELLAQPVRNLEDFKFPQPQGLKAQFSCSMPCHKNYLNYSCATRNAHKLFSGSSITYTPAPLSAVHPNLHVIAPHLIRVYHVCNDDVITLSLLQLYKKTLTTYTSISLRHHVSTQAGAAVST